MPNALEAACDLVSLLTKKNQTVVLAESCTGGLVSGAISAIPGASAVLWGSFVTYTLGAKQKMLLVSQETLQRHGAVSRECALEMVCGALAKSGADIACAITGLAGPADDGSGTHLGTVWIAVKKQNASAQANAYHFEGSREDVRNAACVQALLDILNSQEP